MSVNLNTVLETLIRRRIIVAAVLAVIVFSSLGFGYYFQTKQNRENEAANLYDQTWDDVYAVVSEVRNPESTAARREAATALYIESIKNIDTLIFDYPETVSAARASLLMLRVVEDPSLKAILGSNVIESAQEGALEIVQKKNPKFWAAASSIAEGIRLEKSGRFAEANISYEKALASDKQKYLSDYALILIARNKEILDNKLGALEDYQTLVDQYPRSPWNNFALGKIFLISQNKAVVPQGEPTK